MKFIVAGRSFDNRIEAITFATTLAEIENHSVDVEVEIEIIQHKTKRSWLCRMHPPGVQKTIIRKTAPNKVSRATGE